MTLPSTMRYVHLNEPGGVEAMSLAQMAVPTPQAGEVLIRVMAAGVNRPDLMQRTGRYPPPPGASPIMGLEVAGEVVALGAGVQTNLLGQRVTALVNGGGYAEFCVSPHAQCLPWPSQFSALQAAALPETYFTVWANLFEHGKLAAGERVLIHGGTSGIGVAAIQLAKAHGATVLATAGSDQKCLACVQLGADLAINYQTEDFVEKVAAFTDGHGVDVIIDIVGAAYFQRNLNCLALDGRLVQVAIQSGGTVHNFELFRVMQKRLIITGSTLRPRTTAEKGRIATALHANVWPWLESGQCRPIIDRVFALDDVASAHAYLESGTHIGKVMLDVASPNQLTER